MFSEVRGVAPDVACTWNSAGEAIWLPTRSQTSAISVTLVFEVMGVAALSELPTYHCGEIYHKRSNSYCQVLDAIFIFGAPLKYHIFPNKGISS